MTTFKNDPEQNPAAAGEEAVDQRTADFAAHARKLLLESVDHLDGRTRSRLTQARYAALAELDGTAKPRATRWLLPAGSLAALAGVAMIWLGVRGVDAPAVVAQTAVTSPLDDMEIMAGAENLELLEDLEFYAWLEAEAALPAAGGGAG